MSDIYVLTLNWNGLDKLKHLTPGLINVLDDTGLNTNWLVRDNGSKDNSVQYLKNNYNKNIHIFEIHHNRDSFSKGVNYLYDKAKAIGLDPEKDFILLLNNDIIFNDNSSLKKMFELMMKTKSDVVGARLLYKDTNFLQHAGVIFGKRYGLLPYHFKHKEESDEFSKKNRYFQAVTAACCLVRASAYEKIGGMDEGFLWAFDDVDMCLRIHANHGKIAYCGETDIYHEESASLKKNPVNKMFQNSNVERFRKKWTGHYEIDHEKYLTNPSYKEIK